MCHRFSIFNVLFNSFGGDPGYTQRPLLYHEDGHIIIQYSRRHFTGYGEQKRSTNIPPISEGQAEALDALHYTAEKFSLGLNFQKGDIQYINSMGLLHARDAFKDSPEHTWVYISQLESTYFSVCLWSTVDTWFVCGWEMTNSRGRRRATSSLSGRSYILLLLRSSASLWIPKLEGKRMEWPNRHNNIEKWNNCYCHSNCATVSVTWSFFNWFAKDP